MKQRALVSLDMVLDTRYGTLRRIDEKIADALVASPVYAKRHHDDFHELTSGGIDLAQYRELYAARDEQTLFQSRFTDFIYHLRKDFLEGQSLLDRGVIVSELSIDINAWPYKLTAHEQDVIHKSISHYLPRSTVKVKVVEIAPEELPPLAVDNSYEMMAWYDFEEWLRPHYPKGLIDNPIARNVFITPMIAPSGIVPAASQEIRDPFLARSAVYQPFITLHHCSPAWVCHNPAIPILVESQRRSEAARLASLHQEPDSPQGA